MKLVSEYFIKPKPFRNRINLTPVDIVMLRNHPIQNGLLYTLPRPCNASTILNLLDNLKHSLSIALVHFYPLAGRFVTEALPGEHACVVFIDCNVGPGAKLTHVDSTGLSISDILLPNHVPNIVRKFFDFGEEYINYESHSHNRPLLSVQVTQLANGLFIGFSINHSVVDGTSFMHFLSMLSKIFHSNETDKELSEITRIPVYNEVSPIKLPYLGLEKIMTRCEIGPLRDRIFHFSKKQLAIMKALANQRSPKSTVSTFQALVSLIWRSITRARNLSAEQETLCWMIVNARPRLDPPLSSNQFGNHLSQVKVVCKVGDLLSRDLGWAAKLLNQGVKALNNGHINGLLNWLAINVSKSGFLSSIADAHEPNPVVIGGSATFNMYEYEFGLGKALAILMGGGNKKDGKVTANPGCKGGGSVDLEVSLPEQHMAALELDPEFMSFAS